MNFLITECGLTPTIIAENPLVLTSDPYILKERCLFLQYYIENNGIPSSLNNFDFIRLKGKTTQGTFSRLVGSNIPGTVPVTRRNCPGQLSANKTYRFNNRSKRDRPDASWEFTDTENPR